MKRFVVAAATLITAVSWLASPSAAELPAMLSSNHSADIAYCKGVMSGRALDGYSDEEVRSKRRTCANLLDRVKNEGHPKREEAKQRWEERKSQKQEAWGENRDQHKQQWKDHRADQKGAWQQEREGHRQKWQDHRNDKKQAWGEERERHKQRWQDRKSQKKGDWRQERDDRRQRWDDNSRPRKERWSGFKERGDQNHNARPHRSEPNPAWRRSEPD